MVTKIMLPKSLTGTLYYNEHKVTEGTARLLYAGNFLKEPEELTIIDKKQEFARLIALNKKVRRTTLHASLNFVPGEKLNKDQMLAIAREYMQRIGFGEQPYLVYEHLDAAHPHMHIVSTTIKANGDPVNLDFIGRDRSEPARIALEEKYGLVRAADYNKGIQYELKPVPAEKAQYGKRPTKQSIGNALQYILKEYRFRSLPEFNAILHLYNLKADPGKVGGRIHAHGGLLYQILDEKGKGIGVPIKASSFHFKPTLKSLETKYAQCKRIETFHIERAKLVVEKALKAGPKDLESFKQALSPHRIIPVPYINKQGLIYGLSLVDLEGKLVLKASDLGKGYSAQAIARRLSTDKDDRNPKTPANKSKAGWMPELFDMSVAKADVHQTAELLLRSEFQSAVPWELTRQLPKKKKPKSRKI